MHVLYDVILDQSGQIAAGHYVDLRMDANNVVRHPDDQTKTMHRVHYIARLNDDKYERSGAGWDQPANQRLFPGMSQWDVLVRHANHPDMPEHIRLLKLH